MDIIYISLGIAHLPETSTVLFRTTGFHKVVSLPELSASHENVLALWTTGHSTSPNPAIPKLLRTSASYCNPQIPPGSLRNLVLPE